jgi:hypothetical protein
MSDAKLEIEGGKKIGSDLKELLTQLTMPKRFLDI